MSAQPADQLPQNGGKRITGRHVLYGLIAFFGFITVVNIIMITAAVSTFGGLETTSSYRAGLEFGAESRRAAEQDALGWRVDIGLDGSTGDRNLVTDVKDSTDLPITGLSGIALLQHPADQRRDVEIDLQEIADGSYSGDFDAPAGPWTVELRLYQGEELAFRSINTVTLE